MTKQRFDQMSEEALEIAKNKKFCKTSKLKTSEKIKQEVSELKHKLDKCTITRTQIH